MEFVGSFDTQWCGNAMVHIDIHDLDLFITFTWERDTYDFVIRTISVSNKRNLVLQMFQQHYHHHRTDEESLGTLWEQRAVSYLTIAKDIMRHLHNIVTTHPLSILEYAILALRKKHSILTYPQWIQHKTCKAILANRFINPTIELAPV